MPRRRPDRTQVSERDWQNTLVQALETFGYVVEHTYPLMTKHGVYRTGSTLKGKPDLIAIRPPRLLAIECKNDRYKPTREQIAVLSLYAQVPCARAWVLRPRDDWDTIVSWLRRPKAAPTVYGFELMPQLDAFRVVASTRQRTTR